MRLDIIILTRDEELNLPRTLASLAPLNATIYLVDSGSRDATVAIGSMAGCIVVEHPFVSQADQLNWALDNLPLRGDWVMRLDADERISPELAGELPVVLASAPESVTAFEVKRRVYFWGSWIRHGGYYPTWLLRVWRPGTARSEQRLMDEHIKSSRGHVGRLAGDIIDENRKGLGFWIDKHNNYADREVREILSADPSPSTVQIRGQAGRRRWAKKNLYQRCPLFVRAFAYWALRYFLLLGFLDGKPGLVFHFLQGFWYRFLVDSKLVEAREALKPHSDRGLGS